MLSGVMMQILSIDPELNQRCRLRCALDLTGNPYELTELSLLGELEPSVDISGFRLALVSAVKIDTALAGIVFLRGRMPSGHIIAYGEFNALDSETPSRIRAAGADVVLDSRFSPSKMALVIDRFVWDARTAENDPGHLSSWLVRKAMRIVAPAAYANE